jgi:hypothetical protein
MDVALHFNEFHRKFPFRKIHFVVGENKTWISVIWCDGIIFLLAADHLFVCLMVFNTTCNNISYIMAVSFIGGEPRKNQQVADKLSQNVVYLALIEIQTSEILLTRTCSHGQLQNLCSPRTRGSAPSLTFHSARRKLNTEPSIAFKIHPWCKSIVKTLHYF